MIALDPTKPLVWTVPGFLSAEACRDLVARTEAQGCEAAPVTTGRGFVMRPDIRNNDRAIFEDVALAAVLFDRARAHVPDSLLGRSPCGANERFRAYRSGPGQRFKPHYDGAFVRSPDEQSLLTFMIYLNDDFEGGETAFLDLEQLVVPRTGDALFFQHHVLHEGREVTRGTKYVLRSDVMYRATAS